MNFDKFVYILNVFEVIPDKNSKVQVYKPNYRAYFG